MIEVIVNRPSFEYDIHSLVKSFFPREDVQIHVQDTFTEDTALRISVEFTDETVSICPDGAGRRKRIRCVRHQLCRTERDEKPAETPIIPVAVCIHGTDSSMGNPDGNPSGEDCHGTDRAGHEQCRDRRIYAEYLSGKQGKGGTECHDRQPGTVCASKY